MSAASPRTGPFRPFVIRDVTDPWAMRALEDVQVAAWGYADREVLPATMFRIGAHTGATVLGAYPAEDVDAPPSAWLTGFRRCKAGDSGTTRTCWPFIPTGAGAARRWPSSSRSGSGRSRRA